ncbi:MAG: DUF2163 domain-containing protein [Rhodobacter sp.]|nr:DUF2163 domain-containing protein [Rhodobacter sp.]
MAPGAALQAHLESGTTTLCRAWAVVRADGAAFGFTDHDRPLSFEGIDFKADSGLSAAAISQATGLAVDNTEAVGVLSDAALREDDIQAGRFDGAAVTAWLVNWADVDQRLVQFRGTLGEVKRSSGAFQAELRGLTEALNQPTGRVYQTPCAAVLGDAACGFDLDTPGYAAEIAVEAVEDRKLFRFAALAGFDDRWFERGRLRVLSGAAEGLVGLIKNDRLTAEGRSLELWQALGAAVAEGDTIRIEAGCDKRAGTCRLKFNNFLNFRGFPHIPGEDWLMAYPTDGQLHDGGSLVE